MNDQDLTWLVGQIAATAELLGHEIKPNAAALLADDLSTYPRDVLAKADDNLKASLNQLKLARAMPNDRGMAFAFALDERGPGVWRRRA